MLKEREDFVRKLVILADALVIALAFWFSFLARRHLRLFYHWDIFPSVNVIPQISSSISDYILVLFGGVGIWCLALYSNGMYKSMRTRSFASISWIIVKSAIITTACFSALIFVLKLQALSRSLFFVFIILSCVLLVIEKIALYSAARSLRRRGYNFRRILIIGTGRRSGEFIGRVQAHPEWGLKIAGIIEADKTDVSGLERAIRRSCIDEAVFIVEREQVGRLEELLRTCETMGTKATLALDFFDLKLAKAIQTELDGVPFMSFETTHLREWQFFAKRAIDVIISSIAIILFSPLMAAAALSIKLTSAGPVFFLQKRLGLNGRKFILYKFRTMHNGAHRKQRQLAGMNMMQGPVFKLAHDPRITALGRLLRKFSIDELPQLFNVFLGDMSLVGPRPPVMKEVKRYELWQRRRLSMPPGITCLWQVNGRNRIVDFNEWMNLDLQYIDKWSIWLDLKVMLKTVPAVFLGKGAY